MMNSIVRNGMTALAVAVFLATMVFAQSSGSITGTVKDSSGAAVPGATVTIANPAQAVSRTTTTNAEGVFVAPQLPPGTYSITVELRGFKKAEKSQVILTTGSKINVGELILVVGDVTETVTVQADIGQLQIQTESAERSDLVTNKQIRDIALSSRNIVDLIKTIPGVMAATTTVAGAASTVNNLVNNININGTRVDQHEYTVDGVTNLNIGNNTGALVTLNPDAVEEMKVLTSNYQAEYGKAGGGFIALTTRSGTSQYHGGARYFRRHDSLNANNFFTNANGQPRPLYRYNYYGYDLGGPVPLVGSKDNRKLFFFFSEEFYDQLVPQASPINIRVPTDAERKGDFFQTRDGNGNPITIKDPLTGQPFTGNVIQSSRFFPGIDKLFNIFPLPNIDGGYQYNYTSQKSSEYPRREDILRLDWQIASGTRLSFRYIHNRDEQRFSYGTTSASWNFPLAVTNRKNGPGNTFSTTLTHSFSPKLMNEFVLGLGHGGVNIVMEGAAGTRNGTGINTPLLYPNANDGDAIPSISFSGIANQTFPNTSFNGSPFHQSFKIANIMDNLTKVSGSHTFKVGFYWQRATNERTSFGPVQTNLAFVNNSANPLNTGHPFANALLGIYDTYDQASVKLHNNFFSQNIEGYAQDTWKIHRHLTLDYGLRLSYYEPIYDQEGQLGLFNPKLFDPTKAPRIYRAACVGTNCTRAIDPAITAPPTLNNTLPSVYVGRLVPNSGDPINGMARAASGAPRGGIESASVLWGPRLGFAWDMTGNRKTVVRGGFGITYDRIRTDVIADAITNPPTVQTPRLYYGTLADLASAAGSGTLAIPSVIGMDPDGRLPTVYSYSIGAQHDIGAGITVDAAYVGTQSRHNTRQRNLNSLPYGVLFQAWAQEPTRFSGGVVPSVEPNLQQAYKDAGLSFSGQFARTIDFLRSYSGYGDISYRTWDANASYNSLQASVLRRFSRGFTFGISYMLSKVQSTSDAYSTYTHITNAKAYDYTRAGFDRTHYVVANYIWNIPKGSKLLGGNPVAKVFFDEWTISGISMISSGNPAELPLSVSGVDTGQRILGTYTGGNSSAQQPRFLVSGDPHDGPSGLQVNPAAFTVPGIGAIGPYPRNYLRNPGINNHDLSIFKKFLFGGEGSRYLQLRLEMFNFLTIPSSRVSTELPTSSMVQVRPGRTSSATILTSRSPTTCGPRVRPARSGPISGNTAPREILASYSSA
jgi:hypothetical protein